MSGLLLKYNDDGRVTGLDVEGLEGMTNSDGSVTFYADKLYKVNPQTGEKVEIRPTVVIRNGEDIVSIDNYVNPMYIFSGK